MANEYAYNIVLGGKVDEKTLQNSIQTALKGIKFQIQLDKSDLRRQVQEALKNLKINVGVSGGGSGGGGGGSGGAAELDTTGASSIRTTFNAAGEKISETAKIIDDATHSTTKYWDATKGLTKTVTEFSDKTSVQADKSYTRLKSRIDALSKSNVVGAKNIKDFNERLEEINKIDDPAKRLEQFQALNQEISDTKKQSMGLTKQITTAMGKFLIWSAVTVSYFALVRKLKDVVVQVKELDDALVELKKVSDLTGEGVEDLTDRAFALGQTVAKTGIDVIKAITEIKRAGYDLAESEYLAKYALMMTNVAEGIDDAGEAAQIFVSILKGTGKDVSYASTLLDEMNQISNNAAIGFDDLASMTQRAAATLNTLGTDVEHTMGLITGAYEVLQDERVAKGLSVIGLRIQGLNEDMEEEAGLQSKINEALEKYAGISVFDTRTGQLRDYYSILADLAGVWNSISKNAQVYLTTTLAGKNRADVLNALMKNWQGVENAVDQATNSLGSAEKEQENYINSISGKLAQLSSAWQDMARSSWESDWSKGLLELATNILLVIRYGGGLIPVLAAATAAIIAFKVQSAAATATLGVFAGVIATVITVVGLINKAEADRQAALEENNRKIQENIDKLKTQYSRYSELRGEVDSLKEEQEKLMAIENKTAEQKKRLIQITKQLSAAQKELNDYVGEGANATEEYSLALLKQIGESAGQYVRDVRNKEAYRKAVSALTEKKSIWDYGGDVADFRRYAEDYISEFGFTLPEIGDLGDILIAYKGFLRDIYEEVGAGDQQYAALMEKFASIEAMYDEYEQTIAEYEKYQTLSELYGSVNIKAVDNLTKTYQKWTNSTVEQKIAMIDTNGELTKSIAAVEALKEKYPAATEEIDSFTSSILDSVQAFKEQDRYLDALNEQISAKKSEKEAWQEGVDERKAAEELAQKRADVAKAEKALAEAEGTLTDAERERLELALQIAQAQMEALELADKETEKKKEELEYEEKVLAVQKAQADLANAQNKKVQVYRAGQGMVYISDYSAVEAAQKTLTSAQQSLAEYSTTKSAKARKESAQAAIDAAQDALDEYDKKVKQKEDIAKAKEDLAKAKQILADYEAELAFDAAIADLESFGDAYNDLMLKYGADVVRDYVNKHYSRLSEIGATDFFNEMATYLARQSMRNTSANAGGIGGIIASAGINEASYADAIQQLRELLFPELANPVPSVAGSVANSVVAGGDVTTYQIENVNIEEAGNLTELFQEIQTRTTQTLNFGGQTPTVKP